MPADARRKNLRTLAVMAGLFVLPLAAAFWLYYGTAWRPAAQSNHGELIVPPRLLPAIDRQPIIGNRETPSSFRGRWTLVYVGNGRCAEACQRGLYVMRQTRLSLNERMSRVDRVFLVTSECCARDLLEREHPGLLVYDVGDWGAGWLDRFPARRRDESIYIVDPLGNLMMRYDERWNPGGLLEDLKKLLSLSHIG